MSQLQLFVDGFANALVAVHTMGGNTIIGVGTNSIHDERSLGVGGGFMVVMVPSATHTPEALHEGHFYAKRSAHLVYIRIDAITHIELLQAPFCITDSASEDAND